MVMEEPFHAKVIFSSGHASAMVLTMKCLMILIYELNRNGDRDG
jgi:hypothetical protein